MPESTTLLFALQLKAILHCCYDITALTFALNSFILIEILELITWRKSQKNIFSVSTVTAVKMEQKPSTVNSVATGHFDLLFLVV